MIRLLNRSPFISRVVVGTASSYEIRLECWFTKDSLPRATTQALANLSLADLLSSENVTPNACEFEENRAEWFWPE